MIYRINNITMSKRRETPMTSIQWFAFWEKEDSYYMMMYNAKHLTIITPDINPRLLAVLYKDVYIRNY